MCSYPDDEFFVDANGCPTERVLMGGLEVIVHYDDIPAKDLTILRGIPCTTALRTMIDIAPTTPPEDLRRMVGDCLRRVSSRSTRRLPDAASSTCSAAAAPICCGRSSPSGCRAKVVPVTRTSIDVDARLLAEVMRRYGLPSRKAAVDLALRRLVGDPMSRAEALAMEGTGWEGDLQNLRPSIHAAP